MITFYLKVNFTLEITINEAYQEASVERMNKITVTKKYF